MISPPTRKQAALCPYDFTWARRTRHAFRLLVTLFFVFTFALWFAEGYLRYDRSETQYRMALTLHPAQARPILRAVVRRETERHELPPSRYVEALALVEEPEFLLENYELAFKANPRNASLIINYGCVLYQDGDYEEARERFREAGANPPRNILPRYLEAAALAAGLAEDADLSDVIALLTRANASEGPVLFPEPLWHESLPEQGQRYLEQRREIARRVIIPLSRCAGMICARARASISQGEIHDWDNWLTTIAVMGARLMGDNPGDSPPAIPQLVAALEIQREATQLRADISQLAGGVVASELNDALLRFEGALDALHEFDAGYHQSLTLQYFRLFLPITLLFETVLAFLLLYSAGWFLHHLGSGGKSARAVPHVWIGRTVPILGLAIMLAMLFALMIAHNTAARAEWEYHVPLVWRCVLGVLLLVGVFYPLLLARMRRMFERTRECADDLELDNARQSKHESAPWLHYIGVYGCILRRYAGILTGGLIIMVCLWLLAYRVAYDIYPFQMELIASGVGMETDILIEEVWQYLTAP